jgi:peptide deformylase
VALSIIPMCDSLLHHVTEPVAREKLHDPEIQNNIDQMLSIFGGLSAVGLAAPQVGWNARVFIIGIEDEQGTRRKTKGFPTSLYINPHYEVIDQNKNVDWEGCFSVYHDPSGHSHVIGHVNRYNAIRFSALDREGNPVSGELYDYHARVFQHEYDHLDGVRYVNRLTNGSTLYYENQQEIFKVYMHQLPEMIASRKFPILDELVPVLEHGPVCGLTKKLKQEIIDTFKKIK